MRWKGNHTIHNACWIYVGVDFWDRSDLVISRYDKRAVGSRFDPVSLFSESALGRGRRLHTCFESVKKWNQKSGYLVYSVSQLGCMFLASMNKHQNVKLSTYGSYNLIRFGNKQNGSYTVSAALFGPSDGYSFHLWKDNKAVPYMIRTKKVMSCEDIYIYL